MFNGSRIRPYNLFLDKYQLADGFSEFFTAPAETLVSLNGLHVQSGESVELTLVRLGEIAKEEKLRFEDESERLSRTYHPGLTELLDFGFEGEVAFSVQRKLCGDSLDRIELPLDVDTSLKICIRLADALSELHVNEIRHHSLAARNLWIRGSEIEVSGLGPQRFVRPSKLGEEFAREFARFAAPEQISGLVNQQGTQSDLYAVGVLLFRLLTSTYPFDGPTCNEIFQAQLTVQPDWSLLPESTPECLLQLLSRMLCKDPRKRHLSAASLFEALNDVRDQILGGAKGAEDKHCLMKASSNVEPSRMSLRREIYQGILEPADPQGDFHRLTRIRSLFEDGKILECAQLCENEIGDGPDSTQTIEQKTTFAACQYHLGNLKAATLLAKDVYFAAQELNDSTLIARAFLYWSLGSLGRLPSEIVERETTKNLKDTYAQSATLIGEGLALLHENRIDESLERMREAVRIAESTNHRQNATLGSCWISTLLRLQYSRNKVYACIRDKRFVKKMVATANRAIKKAKRNEKWLAFAFRELAAAYAFGGKGREAKSAFLKSVNYAKNSDAEYEKVKTYALMSDFSNVFRWNELEHIYFAARNRKSMIERNLMEVPKNSFSAWDRFDMLLHAGRLISASNYRSSIETVTIDSAIRLLRCQKAFLIPVNEFESVAAREQLDVELIKEVLNEESTVVLPSDLKIATENRFGSYMVTPVKVANEIDSVLYVLNEAIHGLFGPDEIKIADFLCSATGAAFLKADSIGELQDLNDGLESKVQQRTELIEARSKELEKTAAKLKDAKIQLEKARDVAENANQAKSEFLARMSHEIRTPIAAINGFTELMLRGVIKEPEERLQKLETIYKSGRHLLNLVNEILDLTKVESDEINLEKLPISPLNMCHEILATLQSKANENGNQLKLNILGKIPANMNLTQHDFGKY